MWFSCVCEFSFVAVITSPFEAAAGQTGLLPSAPKRSCQNQMAKFKFCQICGQIISFNELVLFLENSKRLLCLCSSSLFVYRPCQLLRKECILTMFV